MSLNDSCLSLLGFEGLECRSICPGGEVRTENCVELHHFVEPEVMAHEGQALLGGCHVEDGLFVLSLDVEVVTLG